MSTPKDGAGPRPGTDEEIMAACAPDALQSASAAQARIAVADLLKLATQLHRALDRVRVVERAKGVLMHELGTDHVVAFHTLRSHARSTGQPLGTVARAVLDRAPQDTWPPAPPTRST